LGEGEGNMEIARMIEERESGGRSRGELERRRERRTSGSHRFF